MKEESEKAGLKLNIQKTKIMASSPITSWQIDVKQWQILFSWTPKSLWMVTASMKLKTLAPWKESYAKRRQGIKKQRHDRLGPDGGDGAPELLKPGCPLPSPSPLCRLVASPFLHPFPL